MILNLNQLFAKLGLISKCARHKYTLVDDVASFDFRNDFLSARFMCHCVFNCPWIMWR